MKEKMSKSKNKNQTTESNISLTPKQVEVKITSLLRGIDNTSAVIAQKQAQVADAFEQVKNLVHALGNKPSDAQESGKAVKMTKTKTKESKVVKAAKPKVAGAEKVINEYERPPLKSVIQTILIENGKPMSAALIYQTATAKHGKWSRQSLYNALKDDKYFNRVGEEYENVAIRSTVVNQNDAQEQDQPELTEADRFVASVETQQSTQNLA